MAGDDARAAPIDPDVDLHDPAQRAELPRHHAQVLGVIAAGGIAGAAARHALDVALPRAEHGMPWSTLVVNATGCLLLGVLMVFVVEVWSPHRLVRPFLGVGILGGYTTFSTYAVEIQGLLDAGRTGLALAYLGATLGLGLVAVRAGMGLGRAGAHWRREVP